MKRKFLIKNLFILGLDLKGWKNDVAILYGVQSVPTNLLIGPDGKIVVKNLRATDFQSKIKEIFSKS